MGLFAACALTIVIETLFLYLCGRRDRVFLLMAVCVNAATNLSMNLLIIALYRAGADYSLWIYPMEAAVVLVEFAAYAAVSEGGRLRLLLLTLAANAISYSVGLIINSL